MRVHFGVKSPVYAGTEKGVSGISKTKSSHKINFIVPEGSAEKISTASSKVFPKIQACKRPLPEKVEIKR